MSASMPVIAIIGAGFSGVMSAYHLLHQAEPVEIHLIDPREPHGRGPAYQQISSDYLLNVPAGNMGALADQPGHFLTWLEQRFPGRYGARDFVPREFFGNYLQEMLRDARQQSSLGPSQLIEHSQRVVKAEPRDGRVWLEFSNSQGLWADRVVLATGNQYPANPRLESPGIRELSGYFQNPWQSACLEDLNPDLPVLILGSGLTMVDLVLGLKQREFKAPILAISPHGFIPQSHRPTEPWPDFLKDRPWPQSLSQWVKLVRTQTAAASAEGKDWRAVIDALRPYSSRIWQSLSISERRRFMRHLRHRWGVLRHRLPAEVAERLNLWLENGSLQVRAGRVQRIELVEPAVPGSNSVIKISWTPRQGSPESLHVQRVINCTGPDGNYLGLEDPLFVNLREQGLIQADPMALGLDASLNGALKDSQGRPSNWLYTLGAPLRGLYWESTAVPELRNQALALAQQLTSSLNHKQPLRPLRPVVIWLTGLSGAGKTTLAVSLAQALSAQGLAVENLDGDVIRQVFSQTGFSRQERENHVRRIGYMASRLEHHGVFVIAALISPYRESRDFVRQMCRHFVEVHVSTPLEVCEARDVKGLYARARKGEIQQFTGIDDPFETPISPELSIDTSVHSVDSACQLVLDYLEHHHHI